MKDRNTGQIEMERERKGGGFRQNILVGGKEEENRGEEKAKGWIFLRLLLFTFSLIRNQCTVKDTAAYR